LKLYEYGELNQTKIMSYCGLNNTKHKEILDDMMEKGAVFKTEQACGSKTIIKYKLSEKGKEILKDLLEPYGLLFPRNE
jgi:predicted transcriptional regulator